MQKKAGQKTEPNPTITHVMADESVKESIEGYAVPSNKYTEICYLMLARHSLQNKDSTK